MIEWSVVTREMCHFGTVVDSYVVYEITILDIKTLGSEIVHFFLPPYPTSTLNCKMFTMLYGGRLESATHPRHL